VLRNARGQQDVAFNGPPIRSHARGERNPLPSFPQRALDRAPPDGREGSFSKLFHWLDFLVAPEQRHGDALTARRSRGIAPRGKGVSMAGQNDGLRDLVRAEVRRVAGNAQVEQEYPELSDRGSEFFQKTALEMRNLPEDVPGGRVRAAAQSVELAMRREGTWKEPARAPGGGGRPGEDDETPTAQQIRLAVGITGLPEEEAIRVYKERANEGINVSLGGRLAAHLEPKE
jgi:hypothetical protein